MTTTQAARNRRHKEKARKAGIVSVTVEVPLERRDELRAIAKKMREGKVTSTEAGNGDG